jgi:uncharacterized protein YcnI
VAYRNRTSDEIRDIYVSRLVGGKWTEPRAVHNDHWRIAACPVNGPALSAKGRDVAIAWFTAVGDEGHVYAAFSSDAGDTFGASVRIDDVGAVGRVDVELLPDGSAAVTWIEFTDQRSSFRIRRVERRSRSASLAVSAIASGRSSGYPRLARRILRTLIEDKTAMTNHVITTTVLLLLSATAADAHIIIRPREATVGATEMYTMRVPPEGKVATTSVELDVPDGVTIVTINAAAGSFEQKKSGDRTTSITWKVDIQAAQAQKLTFVATNPTSGSEIAWRVHQRYADGTSSDWVEPAGSRRPGPVTKLLPAQ